MKVNFNTLSTANYGISNYSRAYVPSIYTVSNDAFVRECKKPAPIVSFGSEAPAPQKTVGWWGAEVSLVKTKGGVATVMGDNLIFPGTNNVGFIPYHNGKIMYDQLTGEVSGVTVLEKAEHPVYSTANLKETAIADIKDNQFFNLEEISSKTMMWGEDEIPIKMYQLHLKKHPEIKLYTVYTERFALMPEAYADNSYASGAEVTKIKGEKPRAFKGTAYGQGPKATFEQLPELYKKSGIMIDHFVFADGQGGFGSEYLQQMKDYEAHGGFFNNMTSSHIGHNLGKGYVGGMSFRDMMTNLGLTVEDAQTLRDNKGYQAAVLAGEDREAQWLAKNVFRGIEFAPSNAIEVALLSTKHGTSQRFDVVSEWYAKAIAENPRLSSENIHKLVREMLDRYNDDRGSLGGILNPLNDPEVAYDKPLKNLTGFNNTVVDSQFTVEPFKNYNFDRLTPEQAFEEMKAVKDYNKRNLLDRYALDDTGEFKYKSSEVITGSPNRKFELRGGIDMKKVNALKPDELRVYSMWGRGDFQKGHDIALEAWEEFAKTKEGKNAFLVIGGDMSADKEEAARVKRILKRMIEDSELKGRFVFSNGFAPGYAFASGSDIAILPSRFAPCELTDLEAMKYFCIPMVPNVQGMAQKNFDPRSKIKKEADLATSYKTRHEYYISQNELDYIRDAAFNDKRKNVVLKLCDRYGIKKERFTKFWKEYQEVYKTAHTEMQLREVDDSVVEKLTIKLLEENEEYKLAERALQDGIVTDEMIQAMKYDAAHRPSELFFKNHRELQTTWETNGALHPSGKSSAKLYEELHICRENIRKGQSLYSIIHGNIRNLKENIETTKFIKVEKGRSGLVPGIIIGAAVGIGAGMYYYFKSKKESENIKKNYEPALVSRPQMKTFMA